MTTPTLREQAQELIDALKELHYGRMPERVQTAFDVVQTALAAQPELPEPVARQFQDREGEWHHFTCKRHYDATVKDGTWPIRSLYTAAQLQQAVEQAKPIGGESVLVDGTAYDIPAPVAAELLRLNIELKQAQAKREPMTSKQLEDIFLANGFTIKEGHAGLKPYVFAAGRAIEAHHNIGGKK